MKTTYRVMLLGALAMYAGALTAAEPALWQPYRITPRTGPDHIALSGAWQLGWKDSPVENPSELSAMRWIKGRVPGSVQWALYDTGEYPHPYQNLNAKQYAWVDEKVWYYRTEFEAAPREGFAFLCFDGIDYHARVWLNGTELGRHEGMFGGPMVEVSKLLQSSGANSLVVEVRAANWGVKKTWDAWKPGRIIKPWVLGGRLGAEAFFPLGLWRPVRIEFVPKVHIERPKLVTRNVTAQQAQLTLEVEVLAGIHSLDARLNPKGRAIPNTYRNPLESKVVDGLFSLVLEMTPKDGNVPPFRHSVGLSLVNGRNWVRETISVPNPRLWWPNGLGRPNLYRVQLSLVRNRTAIDRLEFDYGIRRFETSLTAGPQTQDRWANWQFAVNGRRFFAKGINWMPADLLLDLPPERYKWLLGMVRDAGIQVIRIWGGGLIETDDFYRLADEMGLLIWQDLPLGNIETPLWPQDIWEAQVVQNIFRLRNHPSLVIWCGGNEFNPYSAGNAATMAISERSIRDFDGTRPFLRTSPDEGSIHTYPDMDATWFARLYANVPFIAETGIHSIPAASSMREMIAPAELAGPLGSLYSNEFAKSHPDFIHHFVEFQKDRVPRMLSRASHIDDMSSPTLEALVDASQVGAGEYYQLVSDGMQSNYPVTGGLLPWVFKRPWPAVGVMLVDGLGQPSAPYYFLKRTYEPIHVALALPQVLWAPGEKMLVSLRVMNAKLVGGASFQASVEIFGPHFRSIWRRSAAIKTDTGPSVGKLDVGSFTIPASFDDSFFFVVAELRDGAGALVSRSVYWPCALKKMADPGFRDKYRATPQPVPYFDKGPWLRPQVGATQTKLTANLVSMQRASQDTSHARLRIRNAGSAPAFMTNIYLEGAKSSVCASDNFFWLAPGEQRDVDIDVLWRDQGRTGAAFSVQAWNAGPVTLRVPD